MEKAPWFTKSYRRGLMDMHIEDWSDEFMSQYDPKGYVDLLVKANFQSIMIYTNSHVGYCYWPTKSGVEHKCTAGKDVLGQFLRHADAAGLDTILYYSLVFNNWAFHNHEDWRIKCPDGTYSMGGGRFQLSNRIGLCCPNSPGYRAFVAEQIRELCEGYDTDGIFYDMTFWPMLCVCDACKERYAREIGGELPVVVNWDDEKWVKFYDKRMEWLAEFAMFASNTAKSCRPGITTGHNLATVTNNWLFGQNEGVNDACDYSSGDFYGGMATETFICKLYSSLTKTRPFEYMSSRCYPNLHFHTESMPKEMLAVQNYITLAHGGAFFCIDAINPDGTINPVYYDDIGEIFRESQKYDKYHGGDLLADVAIFYSEDSKYDKSETGKVADRSMHSCPHVQSALGLANILRETHIPFTVIGKKNLDDLSKYQVIALPDVLRLGQREKRLLVDFVKNGGSIYASGGGVLDCLDEEIGLAYEGETKWSFLTYITPKKECEDFFGFDAKYPMSVFSAQALARPLEGAEVLAYLAMPQTMPGEDKFVSFHSHPPGEPTDHPSITRRRLGKGTMIWNAAPLERVGMELQKGTVVKLIKLLMQKPLWFESRALPPVEILLFDQTEKGKLLLNLVNIQERIPVIPIRDIEVKVNLRGKEALKAESVKTGKPVGFTAEDGYIIIKPDELHLFDMIEISLR